MNLTDGLELAQPDGLERVAHRRMWKTDILDALEAVVRASIPRALARVGASEILPVREQIVACET